MHQGVVTYNLLSKNQLLSDLFWAINTDGLLESKLPELDWEMMSSISKVFGPDKVGSWFQNLSESPTSLMHFFNSDDHLILGKYFERLLHFFFISYPSVELLLSGHQLFERKATIGELDFVIKDLNTNEIVHIEVAVKYYMGFSNSSKHDLWIGPNGSDTLRKKIIKFSKQLKISDDLKEVSFEITAKKIFLLGYFFQHWKHNKWPYFHIVSKQKNQWLYENEIDEILDHEGSYLIMPKYLWLSFYINPSTSLLNAKAVKEQLLAQIGRISKGIMFVSVDEKSREIKSKYIVAPMKWPRL